MLFIGRMIWTIFDSNFLSSFHIFRIQYHVLNMLIIGKLRLVDLIYVGLQSWVLKILWKFLQIRHVCVKNIGHHIVHDEARNFLNLRIDIPNGYMSGLIWAQVQKVVESFLNFDSDEVVCLWRNLHTMILLASKLWFWNGNDSLVLVILNSSDVIV